MSHILDRHKRAIVGLVNLIRELSLNNARIHDPLHYGAFNVAVKLLKEDEEHPPQDQFTPMELHAICVVVGNHATELLARQGLSKADQNYAAELHRISEKANEMRKPDQRKEPR